MPFSDLWHKLLALPLVVRVVVPLVGAGLVALKAKAIKKAGEKAFDTIDKWFWGTLRRKLAPQRPTNEKTYKGKFQGFAQYANYPHECFFRLDENGIVHTVPVLKTNLLSGVTPNDAVEIDTQVLPGAKVEIVRRVRVIQMRKS